MILYDVDSLLTANEPKENIIQQNLDELSIEEEDIVPRFKTGPRNKPTVHWIVQMAPRARKHILQQGNRLYMGFSSLKVRDFLQVARCLKLKKPHKKTIQNYNNEHNKPGWSNTKREKVRGEKCERRLASLSA